MSGDDQAVDIGLDLAEWERWAKEDLSEAVAAGVMKLVAALKAEQKQVRREKLLAEEYREAIRSLQWQVEQGEADLAAANEVLVDKRRVVRELDVLLNGEDGAAKQASLIDLFPQIEQLRSDLAVAQYQADQWLIQSAYCRKCHIWTRRKDVMHNFPPVCSMCKEPVTYGALTNQLKIEADLARVVAETEAKAEKMAEEWAAHAIEQEHERTLAVQQEYIGLLEAAQADLARVEAERDQYWKERDLNFGMLQNRDEDVQRLQARIAELETRLDEVFEEGVTEGKRTQQILDAERIAELEGSLREMLNIVYAGANDERGHLFSETQLAIKRAEDALEKATGSTQPAGQAQNHRGTPSPESLDAP